MVSKHFAILAAVVVAVSTAFAQVSMAPPEAAAPDSPEAMALKAFQHAPMRRAAVAPNISNGSVGSYNWGGYAVTGTGFTDVKGSWIVPSVDCSRSPRALVAFWVGIDGFSDSTVEQTGTLTWCNPPSPVTGLPEPTPAYYTWYEFYPAALTFISTVPSNPGDQMSAEVNYNGSEFTAKIKNETTGGSFSITQAVPGAQRTSAEWIAEAPATITGIVNLADFGNVFFGDDFATDNTVSGPISNFGSAVQEITQYDWELYIESTPSALFGSSFAVNWLEYN